MVASSAFAAEVSFREGLLSIKDISSELVIGLNSFPGVDVDIINAYCESKKLKTPFIVTVGFHKIVGKTSSGKDIKGATVYIVNPSITTGHLWWKRVSFHSIKEPHWTLFKLNQKTLSKEDELKIKELLQ